MSEQKQKEFIDLYRPVHDQFERFCRARVYGNMEHGDLLNETLLVAFERLETIKNKDAFFSFLCGVAVRLLAKNHRKLSPIELPEGIQNSVIDPNLSPEQQMDLHALYAGLAQLGEDQRESLILFEISGFSIKEIAQIQNASESAVKLRLKRGRERLKALLSDNQLKEKGGQNGK